MTTNIESSQHTWPFSFTTILHTKYYIQSRSWFWSIKCWTWSNYRSNTFVCKQYYWMKPAFFVDSATQNAPLSIVWCRIEYCLYSSACAWCARFWSLDQILYYANLNLNFTTSPPYLAEILYGINMAHYWIPSRLFVFYWMHASRMHYVSK